MAVVVEIKCEWLIERLVYTNRYGPAFGVIIDKLRKDAPPKELGATILDVEIAFRKSQRGGN